MDGCVFCGIVSGKVPANFVYKDSEIAVFTNIKPHAPIHLLLIPTRHVEQLEELDGKTLLAIMKKAQDIVKDKDLVKKGYRIITNGGAAKEVAHLHFHLLGEVAVEREM